MASTKKTGILLEERTLESVMGKSKIDKNTKIFSFKEAAEESLKYFKGDELAAKVWVNKYALKDSY